MILPLPPPLPLLCSDLISTGNAKGDEGLEVNVHQSVNVNTGIYFVKANAVSGR